MDIFFTLYKSVLFILFAEILDAGIFNQWILLNMCLSPFLDINKRLVKNKISEVIYDFWKKRLLTDVVIVKAEFFRSAVPNVITNGPNCAICVTHRDRSFRSIQRTF